jgi:opacity protein-like surface antigen
MVLGTTSTVFPIGFYGLEMGLNYSLKQQKTNNKVVVIEQTDAKNWLLGAELFFSGNSNSRTAAVSSSQMSNTKNSGIGSGIALSIGRFVSNGLLVGLSVKGVAGTDEYDLSVNNDKTKTLTTIVRPFIKKYLSRNRLLSPYWVAGVSYVQTKTTYQSNIFTESTKTSSFGVDGGMGLAYFIGNNLILEAGLANFSYRNHQFSDTNNSFNELSGGVTFSPNFTLNYVIKGGKK